MENMVGIQKVNPKFWSNKKVFITGNSGFKGSWLSIWLKEIGAKVKGYSLEPDIDPNLFNEAKLFNEIETDFGDIRDLNRLQTSIVNFDPDILIHLAAQPLVHLSYKNPIDTYSTNVMGTLNVLEASKACKNLKAIIAVTTDKCYENKEINKGYRENDPMGGYDPYSSSKGCCEILISSYRRSFLNNSSTPFLASARAGNVIAGGDWSKDRLVPDILNAFSNNEKVLVRNPSSIRPWQHVLDPLGGYLILAENLFSDGFHYAEPWNFGPEDEDCKSVKYITEKISEYWGEDSTWEVGNNGYFHEAKLLKLDITKAKTKLGWKPKWNLNQTLKNIVNWHKKWINKENIRSVCSDEIKNYMD